MRPPPGCRAGAGSGQGASHGLASDGCGGRLGLGLAAAAAAAEPADLLPLLGQSQPPPVAPKPKDIPPTVPPPPARPGPLLLPAIPPTTTPPGTTTPPSPTLAPVTNTVGSAPESLASSGAGFTPYMMGDLPATGFVRGTVSFPGLVSMNIPPVVINIPPQIINNDGVITVIPGRTIVVTPGRTVTKEGTVYA